MVDKNALYLVTGGAGFIGSNLCEAILSQGGRVCCIDNLSTGKRENVEMFADNENYSFMESDIRNLDDCMAACDGVDYVLHQAAWGSVPRSVAMPLLYEEINIRGTLNMLEAARQTGVKRFVYASSSSVYGDSDKLPKIEGTEGKALSPYALTKKVNEEYAALYYKLYGLKTVGLRYFNVFGKRQDPSGDYAAVIPRFIKLLLEGKPPVINGDGRQSRDFTYIENVVEANLKSVYASDEALGKAFNIAFGGRESVQNVFDIIAGALNVGIKPVYGPERAGDVRHSHADIGKARRLLNYDPKYSFEDGIKQAIEWYRRNLA